MRELLNDLLFRVRCPSKPFEPLNGELGCPFMNNVLEKPVPGTRWRT